MDIKTDMPKSSPAPNGKIVSKYVTDCHRLNVRKDPNPNADILGILKRDDRVLVVESYDNPKYAQIKYGISGVAYVLKEKLKDRF